jgi:hypothetical protein
MTKLRLLLFDIYNSTGTVRSMYGTLYTDCTVGFYIGSYVPVSDLYLYYGTVKFLHSDYVRLSVADPDPHHIEK